VVFVERHPEHKLLWPLRLRPFFVLRRIQLVLHTVRAVAVVCGLARHLLCAILRRDAHQPVVASLLLQLALLVAGMDSGLEGATTSLFGVGALPNTNLDGCVLDRLAVQLDGDGVVSGFVGGVRARVGAVAIVDHLDGNVFAAVVRRHAHIAVVAPHRNPEVVHCVHREMRGFVVEGLLEARQSDRGLQFNDVVTMAAVLEQMMFDESMTLLQAAYRLNSLSLEDHIDQTVLHKVLLSYLLLFNHGSKANLVDIERHQELLRYQKGDIEEFEHGTVLNYEFANRHKVNPFKPRLYSFEAVSEIMQEMAEQYGKFQNHECREMKAHLVELDPEGLGQVPLGLFYGQPKGSAYHFSESPDYLRSIGALDETSPSNPKVIITNYVAAPSNCIASSSYYSVCCLSECSEMMAELEHLVGAPAASPQKLLASIGHLSDKALPRGLLDKLHAIAARNDGEVPLHGRLFAQWLHFAFPHKCPYPSLVQSSASLTASQWFEAKSEASVEEREQHITSPLSGLAPSTEEIDIDGRWSDHEILPLHDRPSAPLFEFGTGAVRVTVQLVAVLVVLRSALVAFRGSAGASDKAAKTKKDDDCALGFHV